ncbi:MAG: hypothetical protein PHS65_09310 [Arcobacteraceae bacterium]|nr:hypothetical protein [Arcobacteraceae bacterium]
MANDIENKENETDDDSINIDDIEGLERDLPLDEENKKPQNETPNDEEVEPLEILPEGKLKTAKDVDESGNHKDELQKRSLKERLKEAKNIRILLVVLALLIIAILAFIYMSSSEKPIEEKPVVMTKSEELAPLETYEFKLDHINVSRLNKKLENLTKYELLGMTEEEYLKEEKLKALRKAQEEEELKLKLEKEALEKEALEKAKEEELALQEKLKLEQEAQQAQQTQETQQPIEETNTVENEGINTAVTQNTQEVMPKEETIEGHSFLKFIQINTNKKVIYKSYLKELKVIDTRIHACRNINNIIEVFIGPLNEDEASTELIEAVKKLNLSKSIMLIEITKEEFANRCMVYEN